MGWVVSATSQQLYPRERPGNRYIGGLVGPSPVWTCAEILASTGIRPASSESLHRLSYPGPLKQILKDAKLKTEREVKNRAEPSKEAKFRFGLKYHLRREKKKRKKITVISTQKPCELQIWERNSVLNFRAVK
jgi:hypothetical protein